jgi:hypothetical protein
MRHMHAAMRAGRGAHELEERRKVQHDAGDVGDDVCSEHGLPCMHNEPRVARGGRPRHVDSVSRHERGHSCDGHHLQQRGRDLQVLARAHGTQDDVEGQDVWCDRSSGPEARPRLPLHFAVGLQSYKTVKTGVPLSQERRDRRCKNWKAC